MAALSAKQRRFVQEYLIDLNATAAYKRAGYKGEGRSAENSASRLLGNVGVQAAIQEALKEQEEVNGISTNRVWKEWSRLAFSDIGEILDFSGPVPKMRPSNEISEDARRAISSFKVKRYVEGKGEDAREVEIIEFKLWDKPGTVRDVAKAKEMFVDRVEHTGKDGEPIGIVEIIRTKKEESSGEQ